MKNYKIWLGIVLTLLVVNSVVLAIMWFHRHPRLGGRPAMQEQPQPMEPKDVLIRTLAFTPKQAVLFDTLRHQHRTLVNKLERENRVLHDSLFANIKKPKADTVLINTITKKISDNQEGIEKATLYHFREVRAMLNPEQQSKFDGIINQVLQMMGRPGPPQGNGMRPGQNGNAATQGPPPGGNGEPGKGRRRHRFGPPPDGRPQPPMDKDGHPLPPPDGRPPGPDGRPPHGPPPGGGPPDGPPPNGRPPQGPPPEGQPPLK